jgi:hypothetical protein
MVLDDKALWRVSRSQPTVEDSVLLDALVAQRSRRDLSEVEAQVLRTIIDRHDRVMVPRAEAMALLQQRGHDMTDIIARA